MRSRLRRKGIVLLATACTLLLPRAAAAQPTSLPATQRATPPPRAVSGGESGQPLKYLSYANGDRVPDFSYAGYRAAAEVIPDAPIRVVVAPVAGDNTSRIQAALNYVATLPPDTRGLRGAVLLKAGRFDVSGGLRIAASGVVLRGSGTGEGGTLLVATGIDRRTLITIAGADDRRTEPAIDLANEYVPVNADRVRLTAASALKPGDRVIVRRPCTAEWIKVMGMTSMGGDRHGGSWKPGTRELKWDRTLTEATSDTITLDAPLAASIDPQFGIGTIAKYEWPGRIHEVGIENVRLRSEFDKDRPRDEEHAWIGISVAAAEDCWVRQVVFEHFVGGAVWLFDDVRRVTVEDCKSLAPVSENAGHRRNTFFTSGQQTLFQRCHSEDGRHDFAVGYCAAGPNAFVQCWADRALEDSGAIDSFAAGVLYDNVRIDGNALNLYDRRYRNHAAGWSAANSFLWQCQASVINCYSPPTARNWAYGCWSSFAGDGEWAASNEYVRPLSLYYAQLADRIGDDARRRAELLMADRSESGPRTPEQQRKSLDASAEPAVGMSQWIDDVTRRHPIPIDAADAKSLEDVVSNTALASTAPATQLASRRLALKNGWLVFGDVVAMGGRQPITWWNGGVRTHDVAEAAAKPPSPTRFVPGRDGPGLTQDLEQVTDEMIAKGKSALDHHYGLWYDVRSADHERVRRMDGDVFPPFYEMPFARSGRDLAWDGLSKYDLTTYNPWYFNRLKTFATIGERKGILLFNQHFFQHNILEAGAHWSSSPWRTANNVNNTGFPEPPHYVGDKYILFAEQFYDVTPPARRELYRAYIRKNLDALSASPNVVHLTSGEFQGPLHFVELWLDVIAEWQRETGKTVLVGLSATKDVQDAILADPKRSELVSVIDIQYWWYQSEGKPFAPPGGVNRAPRSWGIPGRRQMAFEPTLRAVREYRLKHPDKAIVHAGGGEWASLMGGGSLSGLAGLDSGLAAALVSMRPIDLGHPPNQWALGDHGRGYLVYNGASGPVRIDLPDRAARYQVRLIDPKSGAADDPIQTVNGGGSVAIDVPGEGPRIVWLTR